MEKIVRPGKVSYLREVIEIAFQGYTIHINNLRANPLVTGINRLSIAILLLKNHQGFVTLLQ